MDLGMTDICLHRFILLSDNDMEFSRFCKSGEQRISAGGYAHFLNTVALREGNSGNRP
jgi:hypothetical protein